METRRIIFFTYPGAEMLDISGPSSVFASATSLTAGVEYQCVVASLSGGLVPHSAGLTLDTKAISKIKFRPKDTVLVVGAESEPLTRAMQSIELRHQICRASEICSRYGAVCTGSLILAVAGLLEGKVAATHWAGERQLQKLSTSVKLETHALYVNDGDIWTSAGVTSGIDMALAMLECDCGPALKSKVARHLVVYSHRPGSQSQFSEVLSAQTIVDQRFSGLVDWLLRRIDRSTSVEEMADYVGMSSRSFYRHFKKDNSVSPGKFLENLRLNHARMLIEAGEQISSVSLSIGFKSSSAFRTAFKNKFGVAPRFHMEMHKNPIASHSYTALSPVNR